MANHSSEKGFWRAIHMKMIRRMWCNLKQRTLRWNCFNASLSQRPLFIQIVLTRCLFIKVFQKKIPSLPLNNSTSGKFPKFQILYRIPEEAAAERDMGKVHICKQRLSWHVVGLDLHHTQLLACFICGGYLSSLLNLPDPPTVTHCSGACRVPNLEIFISAKQSQIRIVGKANSELN